MKLHEGKQVSPLATNASPLDHDRRAAGDMLRETISCLPSRNCGTDSSGFPLTTLLRNFSRFSMSRPAPVLLSAELETSIGSDMEKATWAFSTDQEV